MARGHEQQPDKSTLAALWLVEQLVKRWNKSYVYDIRHIGKSPSGDTEHLEAIFSAPLEKAPVPQCVVHVFFKILDGRELTYTFESQTVEHKLRNGHARKFEMWLERLLKDKLLVRQNQDMSTPFENSRMKEPTYIEDAPKEEKLRIDSKSDSDEDSKEKEIEDEPVYGPLATKAGVKRFVGAMFERATVDLVKTKEGSRQQKFADNRALLSYLSNIFDAADEDSELFLTHKEVRDLLHSTALGLAEWDILLLLTTAGEDQDTGLIEYRPFVLIAPDIIETLQQRRLQYKARNLPTCLVSQEAVELCYGEEIEETNKQMRDQFSRIWFEGTIKRDGVIHRTQYRQCLRRKPERFTPQEIQMLMQMVPEDDAGFVKIDDIAPYLIHLRMNALHNAMVETDVAALRVHLILLIRADHITQYEMTIWQLRSVLLNADQLCLSRMQVHVLLSIVRPNEFGWVDVRYALQVLCTVIPMFFDTQAFVDKATKTAKELQAAQELAELEELRGIQGGGKRDEIVDEEEDHMPDKDAVEKALIHVGNLFATDRAQSSMELPGFLQALWHESIQQVGLQVHEIRGFIAEAQFNEYGFVQYQDHIRLWVPIIFQLRKSKWYESILSQDWSGKGTPKLVDLSVYDSTFPIFPSKAVEKKRRVRAASLGVVFWSVA